MILNFKEAEILDELELQLLLVNLGDLQSLHALFEVLDLLGRHLSLLTVEAVLGLERLDIPLSLLDRLDNCELISEVRNVVTQLSPVVDESLVVVL